MTTITANPITAPAVKAPAPPPPAPGRFRFPDPPQREPDEMTNYDQLHRTGSSHHLVHYLGNEDTTLVEADRWVARAPRSGTLGLRRPDLFIAFNVNPAAYKAARGYLISEQGKPPDFVLEVASESTASVDIGAKRVDYAALGIPEYWRFDETGEFHGDKLAGDRLVNGRYEPIPIDELPDGSLQGYSAVLNLYLRWERVAGEQGMLGWYDPETGQHIPTFEERQEAFLREREGRLIEREGRLREQAARLQAEAEVRELRERLRQRGGG